MLKRSIFISILFVFLSFMTPAALGRVTLRVDGSFGTEGIVEGRFGPTYSRTSFTSITAQPDGSLLATRLQGSESSARLRRYEPNGALDASFEPQYVTSLPEAIEESGKILRSNVWSLERFNPDGSRDLSFHREALPFRIDAIVPLPSGRVLVAGNVVVYEPESPDRPGRTYIEQLAVARFDPQGRLDPGFGSGGVVRLKSDAGVVAERLLGLVPRPDEGVAVIALDLLPSRWGEAVSHSGSTIVGLDGDGEVDPSYGVAGRVRLAGAAILSFDALSGGALVVAGDSWGPQLSPRAIRESDVFVRRYTADGHLDSGFGGGDGSAEVDLGDIDLLGAMLIEKDGSIVLGGADSVVHTPDCARFYVFCRETPFLLRLSPAGALDSAFGNGGEVSLSALSWPDGLPEGGVGVKALAERPGGGLFAGGGSGPLAFVAAVTAAGSLDESFGSGGVLTESDSGPSGSEPRALTLDSDGRILVAGNTNADLVNSWPRAALLRYLPDGELDRSFGGGYVHLPGKSLGLAIGEDDSAFVLTEGFGLAVSKVGGNGRLDPAFGNDGTVQLPTGLDPVSTIALSGGRLLVAGTTNRGEHIFVLRLGHDGHLDPTFGDEGVVSRGFGRSHRCIAKQVVVQSDGRIVVAGLVNGKRSEERSETFAVMRLRADGSPDRSFGRLGLRTLRVGKRSFASALAVEGNGRILVAGKALVAGKKTRELLARFTADGRLDPRFGHGGLSSHPVPRLPSGFFARPRQILLSHGSILLFRDSRDSQLIAYSRDGRRRRPLEVEPGTEVGRAARAPFAAVQSGKLVLGWEIFDVPRDSFRLQRIQVAGRP